MMWFVFHLVNIILHYLNWHLPSIQKGTFQRWRIQMYFCRFCFSDSECRWCADYSSGKVSQGADRCCKGKTSPTRTNFFLFFNALLSQLWVDRNDIRRNSAEYCWKAVLVAQSICCWRQSRLQRPVWAYCYQLYFHSWPKLRPEM